MLDAVRAYSLPGIVWLGTLIKELVLIKRKMLKLMGPTNCALFHAKTFGT